MKNLAQILFPSGRVISNICGVAQWLRTQAASTCRYHLLLLIAAALLTGVVPTHAADVFPRRPVRIITSGVGSSPDIIARLLQADLSKLWGKPVIVENRPGATGLIALELAARSAPDGHTLHVTNVALAISETTFKSFHIKLSRDLTGVTNLIRIPHLWVVNPAVPVSSMKELVDVAKKSGGKMNYGSTGIGSYPHIDALRVFKHAGIQMTHVPYKSAGDAIAAMMSNEVQFMLINMTSPLPHIRAGRIKPLATTWPTRRPELPDVPTVAEAGYPGFGTNAWNGLFAPAGIPKAVLNRIHADVVKVMDSPAMKDALVKVSMTVAVNRSPEEFQEFVLEEVRAWGKVIADNDIKVQ